MLFQAAAVAISIALVGCTAGRTGRRGLEYEEQADHRAGLRLDKLTYENGATKEQVSALWAKIQQQPDDAASRFELSRILLRNQYPKPAVTLLSHPSCRASGSPQYYLLYANALQNYAPGNLPRVTALLQEGVAALPRDAQLQVALGHALNTEDRPVEAMAEFDKALALPAAPEIVLSAHLGKASAYRKQGNEPAAEKELAEARRILPNLKQYLDDASIAQQLKQLDFTGTPVSDGVHPLPRKRSALVQEEIKRVQKEKP